VSQSIQIADVPADTACWRVAGVLYMAFMLAGLAAGYWPDAVYPTSDGGPRPNLPALGTLAMAQAAFIFLAYPLILLNRSLRNGGLAVYWRTVTLEVFVMTLVAVPFYLPAAWVSDATLTDAIRTAFTVFLLWPTAMVAGRLMRLAAARPAVLMFLLAVMLAAPAAIYLLQEFLPSYSSDWLWDVCPAGLVWQNAAPRTPGWLPTPTWAAAVWPIVAVAVALLDISLSRRYRTPNAAS